MTEHRRTAEREADEDLKKEPQVLLHDIHDELLKPGRTSEEAMVHASKRIASMQVKVAMKNEDTANAVLANTEAMKNLLVALESYAAHSERRIQSNEDGVRSLNRWMLCLTITGVFVAIIGTVFGGMSVWYAHEAQQREIMKSRTETLPPRGGALNDGGRAIESPVIPPPASMNEAQKAEPRPQPPAVQPPLTPAEDLSKTKV